MSKQRMDLGWMRNLGTDWDSYGAKVPTEAAIRAAESVSFVPMPHGGVQVEVHAGGLDIEIEFDPEGEASVFIESTRKAAALTPTESKQEQRDSTP